jgi:hypothetical protein
MADELEFNEAQHRYGTAKGYAQTIKMVVLSPLHAGDKVGFAILPTGMLLGFALELYLKGYLLAKGEPSKTVKAFGHKLAEMFARAAEMDLPEINQLADLIAVVDGPHREFTYRYIDGSAELDVISWPVVFPIIDQLDIVVDEAVGASATQGLKPGH